jgi:hypothetical protein
MAVFFMCTSFGLSVLRREYRNEDGAPVASRQGCRFCRKPAASDSLLQEQQQSSSISDIAMVTICIAMQHANRSAA